MNGEVIDIKTDSAEHNFVRESAAAPLVNAETPRYAAGVVSVRDMGKSYEASIPVLLHLDHTTAKSASGYYLVSYT